MPNDHDPTDLTGPAALAAWAHDVGFATAPATIELADRYGKIIVPAGAQIVDYDIDRFMPAPTRATGIVQTSTVASFADYVTRHHSEAVTVWWHATPVNKPEGRWCYATAILNDHRATAVPEWGDHRAQLVVQHTPEWSAWCAMSGQLVDQETFAEFIEDHLADIVAPAAADMLEIAQSLHVARSSEFSSARRLSDGQTQLTYRQDQSATAGATGTMEIPGTVTLSIAPFIGADTQAVTARFRYRLNGGNLKLGIILNHPDRVIDRAVTRMRDQFTDTIGAPVDEFVGYPR